MKRMNALAIALATVLAATTSAHAERTRDDLQAPRAQELQAPRDRHDEVQAPRGQDQQAPRDGQDDLQAPRGQDQQAPRDRHDEVQAPRGQDETQARFPRIDRPARGI